MILSMTGFGRAEENFDGKKITVEIKSLNSKTFDLNIRVPLRYKEKEFEIRKVLNDQLIRGKVDCYINCESHSENSAVKINQELVQNYILQLAEASPDAPHFEYLKMAVRMPEAISAKNDELEESEIAFLFELIRKAIFNFQEFRSTEGKILEEELTKNILSIEKNLAKVIPFEDERLDAVKERYKKTLSEFQNIDETRFYQEMAYYSEKLDIAEEKVRLAQHLKYYIEVMKEDANGKKLGFIGQEIGREINTLGSKANHSEIQRLVVEMKDDLEKIKEQTLNVL
ncbi:YicC/YloC family endoribonuclease [Halpernia frigidisoli]|uniref:TIGR00255 family protein n=1 Tax=Halpernia frigidisoli TaxID=1125876 RepID=A0A1I3IKT1_9FLAO|nr:YicC/YloC family endoribonuclease [Halpernia frigidisoli]SFI48556.1 TIGR00255 family protein [Halpernia frigidisoli]